MAHSCGNVGTGRPPGWENRRCRTLFEEQAGWGCRHPGLGNSPLASAGLCPMNSRNFQLGLCSGISFGACQDEGWGRRRGPHREQKRWPPGSFKVKVGSLLSLCLVL